MLAPLTSHSLRTLHHILLKYFYYCKQMDAELEYVGHEVNYVAQ